MVKRRLNGRVELGMSGSASSHLRKSVGYSNSGDSVGFAGCALENMVRDVSDCCSNRSASAFLLTQLSTSRRSGPG